MSEISSKQRNKLIKAPITIVTRLSTIEIDRD